MPARKGGRRDRVVDLDLRVVRAREADEQPDQERIATAAQQARPGELSGQRATAEPEGQRQEDERGLTRPEVGQQPKGGHPVGPKNAWTAPMASGPKRKSNIASRTARVVWRNDTPGRAGYREVPTPAVLAEGLLDCGHRPMLTPVPLVARTRAGERR